MSSGILTSRRNTTPKQIAQRVGTSRRNVLYWIERRGLPAEKLGRLIVIDVDVFEDWWDMNKTQLNG